MCSITNEGCCTSSLDTYQSIHLILATGTLIIQQNNDTLLHLELYMTRIQDNRRTFEPHQGVTIVDQQPPIC